MIIDDQSDERKYRFKKPQTPEETVSAIYEELSLTPLNKRIAHPEQTIKGYLQAMLDHLVQKDRMAEFKKEGKETSEAVSLGICGVLGLLLVFIAANSKDNSDWWRTYSYFFFALGTVLTAMFVAASMEKSLPVTRMLKFNSVKIFCAFIFSAAIIYSSAQASSLLNSIFRIDGSNFPYARAILSAAFFLKMCTPLLIILAPFALLHALVVWRAAKDKEDVFLFPWNSVLFIVAALVVAGSFWWITHGSFGDAQIRNKAYKLTHYLDFSDAAYCAHESEESKEKSYLFFGQDQNKVLVDTKLELKESFEEFLKDNSTFGKVYVPVAFKVMSCSPSPTTNKVADTSALPEPQRSTQYIQ